VRIAPFFLILLFCFCGPSQEPVLLSREYSFINTNGRFYTLHQSHDTLSELICYDHDHCQDMLRNHFRILSSVQYGSSFILKLEGLDTVQGAGPIRWASRYAVFVLHDINPRQLGLLPLYYGLTRSQLDTVRVDKATLKDNFYYSYYSDICMKEFALLKPITEKKDIDFLKTMTGTEQVQEITKKYNRTKPYDMYNVGISAEILTKVCILAGFNPISAATNINGMDKGKN